MYKKGSSITVLGLIFLLMFTALPAGAATGGFTSVYYCNPTNYLIVNFTITGTVDDGGGQDSVTLEVYDDGQIVRSETVSVPLNSTQSFTRRYYFPTIEEEAPGLGVLLQDDERLDARDPVEDIDDCGGTSGQMAEEEKETCLTSVPFESVDVAPISGTLRLYIFGGYEALRPEGWLIATIPVTQGQYTKATIADVPCGMHVRAWLYDAAGGLVGLVPSQYENGDGQFETFTEDYGTSPTENPSLVYAASYAKLIYLDSMTTGDESRPFNAPAQPMPSGYAAPSGADSSGVTSPPSRPDVTGGNQPAQPPPPPPPPPPAPPGN